jgi:glutathione S-transferase
MITLHDYELSGNCYKVRLLLSILNVDYQKKSVEFYPAAAHKHDEFLAINPLGTLPALQDNALCLSDSHAILVYIASQYDESGLWYPRNSPVALAQVCDGGSLRRIGGLIWKSWRKKKRSRAAGLG